jgi:CopA family copper-resistance protein
MRKTILGSVAAVLLSQAAYAGTYNLVIDETTVNVTGESQPAMAINGSIPGPELRFREGEEVAINVTNRLAEPASIHWHGLVLPYGMDGVPGISFEGIKPGETFTYRFKIRQSGTYWYHSHSGLQEQAGVYGPLVIEPAKRDPFKFDREYTVLLSDWTDEPPARVMSNLKKQSDYYNYSQRTVGDFFADVGRNGLAATVRDRLDWGAMRMTPTDIADVGGYTFLVNGKNPDQNWTGLFKPGERVRLRFINGSAMSYFDVRIPGLKMTVVQADGNNVQPAPVDEFRIAVAETYDVIVWPREDQAYTIMAEPMARTGYARGTLAPRAGMSAEVPPLRERPLLTMADMGMDHAGMDHGAMDHGANDKVMPHASAHGAATGMSHAPTEKPSGGGGHDHGGHAAMTGMEHGKTATSSDTAMTGSGHHAGMTGMNHGGMPGLAAGSKRKSDFAPGSGLTPVAADGGRMLVYADLKAMKPYADYREPDREIELRLTGNMERYIWSINGVKYSQAEPIRLKEGERVRLKFVNETMMNHPMHLHGMWMQLDNGQGRFRPLKHVVNVAPGTTLSVDVPVDAVGEWAFHCHLLYHMASGMFRKVIVEPAKTS